MNTVKEKKYGKYNPNNGVFIRYEENESIVLKNIDGELIYRMIDEGRNIDIDFHLQYNHKEASKKISYTILQFTKMVHLASDIKKELIPSMKSLIYLTSNGISLNIAASASFFNRKYIDPKTKMKIELVDETLKCKFPEVKFSDNYNGIYVVERKKNKYLRKNKEIYGYVKADKDPSTTANAFLSLDEYHDSVSHERIHQLLYHGIHMGIMNCLTGEGKALNEGFTSWIDYIYFDISPSYIESMYFPILENLFSINEMMKMSAEGDSTENWKNAFANITDKNIVGLLDENIEKEMSSEEQILSFNNGCLILIDIYFEYIKKLSEQLLESFFTEKELILEIENRFDKLYNSLKYLDSLWYGKRKLIIQSSNDIIACFNRKKYWFIEQIKERLIESNISKYDIKKVV